MSSPSDGGNAGQTSVQASSVPGAGLLTDRAADTLTVELQDRGAPMPAMREHQQGPKDPETPVKARTESNSIRSGGDNVAKRRAIPPLEDRFNISRIGLVERAYHFRDQAGKVAFTDRFLNISTASESPAAIKGMVDRAAERGWQIVTLKGSPEFVRQGWIAANAQGLRAVGHTPTSSDREAVIKEQERLEIARHAAALKKHVEAPAQVQTDQPQRGTVPRNSTEPGVERRLATAIEKALVDGQVSAEIREQVRALMVVEGHRRMARGEQFKVPVYDARAPRSRAKAVPRDPQRMVDRERSR